jgi:hypothetical protein
MEENTSKFGIWTMIDQALSSWIKPRNLASLLSTVYVIKRKLIPLAGMLVMDGFWAPD